MQGGTRQKDSYIGHPLPFFWHEGSPRVTGYFPQYKKPRMDTNTKTRSRQRNGNHAQGSRCRLVSPNPTRRKQRKRGGKRRSGHGGQRRKNEKADRLSKRYFRVCSWNCASANRRGAVLEKMVYDFDVVCLQETRTCPNRPLVLQGFTVIQRHEGRGMAIVVRSNLSKTVSLLNLDKWSTSSRELQGIRIEKPDERHKSLILINAYIHTFTCITRASWDFLEQMEDELGDTIMIYGDFNARSSLQDQHGTNQQGCALEAALSDVIFTPVSTASPTHPGTRQGDTDSTIDLALVSPKLVPWTRAETFASHGSDHLPVVFSLQNPGIEQRRKLQYPFQYGKSDMGVMSKLRAHKPAHTTNPRQKADIQPPWWNKETQAAWTDKRTMVKL